MCKVGNLCELHASLSAARSPQAPSDALCHLEGSVRLSSDPSAKLCCLYADVGISKRDPQALS